MLCDSGFLSILTVQSESRDSDASLSPPFRFVCQQRLSVCVEGGPAVPNAKCCCAVHPSLSPSLPLFPPLPRLSAWRVSALCNLSRFLGECYMKHASVFSIVKLKKIRVACHTRCDCPLGEIITGGNASLSLFWMGRLLCLLPRLMVQGKVKIASCPSLPALSMFQAVSGMWNGCLLETPPLLAWRHWQSSPTGSFTLICPIVRKCTCAPERTCYL